MALTKAQVREILSEAGVDSDHMKEAVEKIINGHLASIDVLREEADNYKTAAEKLSDVQKELDKLKAAGDGGLSVLQEKYNALEKDHKKLVKEYDQYKNDQAAKETRAAKEKAYRALAKSVLDADNTGKLADSRLDTVVKAAHVDGVIDGLELDENGGIKDADKLEESVKAGWADFIVTVETRGADVPHPPESTSGGHTMTKEQIMSIKDTGERQRAMAQNLDLFGIK